MRTHGSPGSVTTGARSIHGSTVTLGAGGGSQRGEHGGAGQARDGADVDLRLGTVRDEVDARAAADRADVERRVAEQRVGRDVEREVGERCHGAGERVDRVAAEVRGGAVGGHALGRGPGEQHALVGDVRDAAGRLGDQHGAGAAEHAGVRQPAGALAAGLLGGREDQLEPRLAARRARRPARRPRRSRPRRPSCRSTRGRPAGRPRISPNGSPLHGAPPSGTTSRWPVMHSAGRAGSLPGRRAIRFGRPGACSWTSIPKPAACRRPDREVGGTVSLPGGLTVSSRTSSSARSSADTR